MLWSVHGDVAAGVDEGDEGWRRRSSGELGRREEEEEGEKAKGENEKWARGSIYKAGRINGMHENRGDKKTDMWRRGRLNFQRIGKEKYLIKIWAVY